jgi:hypothetical protein
MTGQIPKYGQWFRHERVAPDFEHGLAHCRYVLKADGNWWIRSNGNSGKWWVFWRGDAISAAFDTMRDAMRACRYAQGHLGLARGPVCPLPPLSQPEVRVFNGPDYLAAAEARWEDRTERLNR